MSNVLARSFTAIAVTLLLIVFFLAAAPRALAAPPNTLTAEELAEGWILLFDGETSYGWEAAGQANWKVADGIISVSEGEKSLLCTTSEFADYQFKADFRNPQDTNSGIFLRTALKPTDAAKDCYELNIADPSISPFPTGSFVGRQKAEAHYDSSQWRTFDVTAQGGQFTVRLDGKLVLQYNDSNAVGRGRIGLQYNSGLVEFRNVKLRPLGLESMFNGKDLAGWTTYPELKSVFSVTPEGHLNVKNGRGQLESNGKYADFVLQLECFSNGKHLNSGFFFRSIPGELTNGYESQIHNGYKDGDRTKPIDCGTGGFYRRQDARKVVANDFEWFHKTLVVSDKHMAAWVNGYQVSDWTDPREPDPNPRKGLRREAGTIIIQGHDPTTDLSFRNLRISEMPKR